MVDVGVSIEKFWRVTKARVEIFSPSAREKNFAGAFGEKTPGALFSCSSADKGL